MPDRPIAIEIDSLRENLEARGRWDLGLRVREISRGHRAVTSRHQSIQRMGHEYVSASQRNSNLMRKKSIGEILSVEELELQEEASELEDALIMEVESLFNSASQVLNRVAALHECCFGPAKIPWKSFNSFTHASEYGANRGLSELPAGFDNARSWLFDNVIHIRNRHLEHVHEGPGKAQRFGILGYNNVTEKVFYGVQDKMDGPAPTTHQVNPEDILPRLDLFLRLWIGYVLINNTNMIEHEAHMPITSPGAEQK